jgi:hypothetical protein
LYAGAELTHDFSVTVEISLACETRPQRQDAAAGPQEIEIFIRPAFKSASNLRNVGQPRNCYRFSSILHGCCGRV